MSKKEKKIDQEGGGIKKKSFTLTKEKRDV